MRRGKLPLPKEELEAEMFEYIIAELRNLVLSIMRFPISLTWFWKSPQSHVLGQLSIMVSVRGFGLCERGAYKNHGPIRHYLNAVEAGNARITEEHLSQREQMEEEMF